jgi:uncharacterized protein
MTRAVHPQVLLDATSKGQEAVQQRTQQVQATVSAASSSTQASLKALQEQLDACSAADVQTAKAASTLSRAAHAQLEGAFPEPWSHLL